MTAQAARWMLAIAVARYKEGSRMLRVYESVLDAENRERIEGTRRDFKTVITATTKRLIHETLA
jgi:hypothetical protein